jgi:solute carrier family 20 (sodium-dependent phosphate transporter)
MAEVDEDPRAQVRKFLFLVIICVVVGFVYAFGIGANDVANSFASTVASKSLTLKQAIVVAGIFEFLGSVLLGASVTNTIRGKIFDVKLYDDHPEIIMLGMTTSIMVGTVMLLSATYLALPVSTTHTVVGCIMGFSISAKGFDSIDWDIATQIFISWIASPGIACIVAFIFFSGVRIFVMSNDHAFVRAYYTFPFVLFGGIGIDLFYVMQKGFNNFQWSKDMALSTAITSSFGVGAVAGFLWLWPFGPIIMKKIEEKRDLDEAERERIADLEDAKANAADEADTDSDDVKKTNVEEEVVTKKKGIFQQIADNTVNQDLHAQSMQEDKVAEELWDNYASYDPDAEQLFTYVQVFTACLNAFAHGANDVANAIAPISGVLSIYETGALSSKAEVQKWILVYGGIGIVLGCFCYGYRVMKSLGYKVTALSPSRGACAELASSLFVVTASFLGIPVSSTQSITGAVLGVGLASGMKSVNWLFFAKVCCGWVAIFFISVFFSAGLFSFIAFSPSLV